MSRYKRSYAGELRTVKKTVKFTPSEWENLDAATVLQGTTFSDYTRELLFRRSAEIVAGTRRNPEAGAIMRSLDTAGFQQQAIGNNLNQIARHLNTTGGDPTDLVELREALRLYNKVTEMHIEALSRVTAL